MQRIGVNLTAEAIMQQLFMISRRSDGQLVSTLQDIHQGRETEIDSLNLAIARTGESLAPPVSAITTPVLSEMVRLKSWLRPCPMDDRRSQGAGIGSFRKWKTLMAIR